MERRSYKDRIERFFREKNNATPSPQEWDDIFFDEAWDAIAPQIKVEKDPPNWGLWTAYFLLLALLVLTPFQNKEGQEVISRSSSNVSNEKEIIIGDNAEMTKISESIEAISKHSDIPNQASENLVKSEDEKVLPKINNEVAKSNRNRTTDLRGMEEERANLASNDQSVQFISEIESHEPFSQNQKSKINKENTQFTTLSKNAIRNTINTAMLAVRKIPELRVQQLVLSRPFQSPTDMESATASSHQFRFGIYSQAGQTQWWKRKEQNYGPNLSYEVEGGTYYEFGLESQFMINDNHGIGLEVGMANQMMQTNYLLAVNYSSQGEFSDGQGNLHNVYQHTLPTILGDVGFNHVLYREPTHNIQEGQEIKFELNLQHEIRSIPVRVAYLYERSMGGNWNLNFATGLTGQIIYNKRVAQSTELISHHSAYHHNFTESTTVKNKSVRDYSINGQFRLGVSYDIGSYRIGVQGEIQETLQEAQLHANHYLHPTIITGRVSILRMF